MTAAAGIPFVVGAVACGVVAWMASRQRRKLADQPTTPAAAVFAGRNEVEGRIWAESPLVSKRTAAQCVVWRWTLEEERTRTVTSTSTNNGQTTTQTRTEHYWHGIEDDGYSLDRFEIVDSSGSVVVLAPDGQGVRTRNVYSEIFRRDDDDGRGFFEKLLSSSGGTGRYREQESLLAVGDQVFSVGFAALDDDSGAPLIKDGPGANLLVTTGKESTRTTWWQVLSIVATLGSVALAIVGGARLFVRDGSPTPTGGVIGAAVALVVIAGVGLVMLYNRLRIVAQMADRAFSLVEVQLKRRADLIPVLARVASASATHERETLAALTAARTVGNGASVAVVDAEVESQTVALQQLAAVGESSPDLQANAAWLQLMAEVADTENRIAGSRHFYNDSITVLRTRRQSFPGVLIARWLPLPRRAELFSAAVHERALPQLTRTFG